MKFGQVENPSEVDFTLPKTHPETFRILEQYKDNNQFDVYVGANHLSDYNRLDQWLEHITEWKKAGLQKLYFFIHQNIELESPLLATLFIKNLNEELQLDLKYPNKQIQTLF
ncbi:MAG TPA: hypothetical protein VLY87_06010 [Flavobacterium sp.]|nr:hypothetical protein [Flavobacterium sp.]